jgi:hypothetical protein
VTVGLVAWVCVRNKSPVGWNRFESPSLPDSELRHHSILIEGNGYDGYENATLDIVIIVMT